MSILFSRSNEATDPEDLQMLPVYRYLPCNKTPISLILPPASSPPAADPLPGPLARIEQPDRNRMHSQSSAEQHSGFPQCELSAIIFLEKVSHWETPRLSPDGDSHHTTVDMASTRSAPPVRVFRKIIRIVGDQDRILSAEGCPNRLFRYSGSMGWIPKRL